MRSVRTVSLLLALVTCGESAAIVAEDGTSALDVFNRRILPILKSDKPSSCAECHLNGVDLKDYIRADAAKTFAALRDEGLVDVENPDQSKLLEFIARAPERPSIVSVQVRQQEYEAFRAWINAAVQDPAFLKSEAGDEPLGPSLPDEVIRHARKDRVLQSFIDNIWSERHRCQHCHSPEFNQKRAHEFDESLSWIKPNDPAGTLERLLEYGQIDLDEPDQSLILLKPTVQVEHRGGRKYAVGDRTYRQFLSFIEDYAAIVKGRYTAAEQLPQPSETVGRQTGMWLRVTGVPRRYVEKLLRAEIYTQTDAGWSQQPVAVSEWPMHEKQHEWQHPLTLLAARGSRRAEELRSDEPVSLPGGRYLVKVYLDRQDKLIEDPRAHLGPEDFVGQREVRTDWRKGPKEATVVSFPQHQREVRD